ncbi:MAG TPA: biotin transporter BioY [Candidatus Kapabacteria bacterium]|jgi:biotin transport system substrate-specific component|nr:biotin transporter BioY [Candidatus Kapabacteria bacterium]HOV92002.1 biotin transporter BioY [Candidatus Kapabacteria bacterium]
MQITSLKYEFIQKRTLALEWRNNLSITNKLLLTFTMAVLTGILAQVKIFLPFTPIPITGQTFAVLLSGILLGRYWGGASQLFYVALGAIGLPWFSELSGGISVLLGPNGGYLFGFILSSALIGYTVDKFSKMRDFIPMLIVLLVANFGLIYIPGLLQLNLWFKSGLAQNLSLTQLLSIGALPFLAGDLLKITLVAGIASVILPKK